jgi:hypothetical protein
MAYQWIGRDESNHFLFATCCGCKKPFFLTNKWVFAINGSNKLINDNISSLNYLLNATPFIIYILSPASIRLTFAMKIKPAVSENKYPEVGVK